MAKKLKSVQKNKLTIDAKGLHYRLLNNFIKEAADKGYTSLLIKNVNGQRYIGTGIGKKIKINVKGTAGADLGAFMDGPEIIVHGNAQDAVGNTMNKGSITVHGHASDVCGIAARNGEIYIKSNVSYRAGIHMKEYKDTKPILVIGGTAYDFLGEYMAGGLLFLLNLDNKPVNANYIGTGMHGGIIYIRGKVKDYQLGKEVSVVKLDDADIKNINRYVTKFSSRFQMNAEKILKSDFIKLIPLSHRPYGKLYTY